MFQASTDNLSSYVQFCIQDHRKGYNRCTHCPRIGDEGSEKGEKIQHRKVYKYFLDNMAACEYVETRLLLSFHMWISTFNFCLLSNWCRVIISGVQTELAITNLWVVSSQQSWNKKFLGLCWSSISMTLLFQHYFHSEQYKRENSSPGSIINTFGIDFLPTGNLQMYLMRDTTMRRIKMKNFV